MQEVIKLKNININMLIYDLTLFFCEIQIPTFQTINVAKLLYINRNTNDHIKASTVK